MATNDTTARESVEAVLVASILRGHVPALARAITIVEGGGEAAVALLDRLVQAKPNQPLAPRLGITGPPGTGKSTLVAQLVGHLRRTKPGDKAAVIAVDPSSPFTGGAILGDRFRMSEVAEDPMVFIRSMASRGALGGLSEATEAAADLLEAAGFWHIVIETVGVGQNEVAIASACETTIVVLNPENGDSIQALKAGLLEVADVVVVNKADHPRADRFVADLESGIELQSRQHGGWITPVVKTIATEGVGTALVVESVAQHREWLTSSGEGERRAVTRSESRIRKLWLAILRDAANHDPRIAGELARLALMVRNRSLSHHGAADALVALTLGK